MIGSFDEFNDRESVFKYKIKKKDVKEMSHKFLFNLVSTYQTEIGVVNYILTVNDLDTKGNVIRYVLQRSTKVPDITYDGFLKCPVNILKYWSFCLS